MRRSMSRRRGGTPESDAGFLHSTAARIWSAWTQSASHIREQISYLRSADVSGLGNTPTTIPDASPWA